MVHQSYCNKSAGLTLSRRSRLTVAAFVICYHVWQQYQKLCEYVGLLLSLGIYCNDL